MDNLTKNEIRVMVELQKDKFASLRRINSNIKLGGATSISYIINQLVKKDYIIKIGKNTSVHYELTSKAKNPLSKNIFNEQETIYFDANLNRRASPEFERYCSGTHY